jgi:hypothetical protein
MVPGVWANTDVPRHGARPADWWALFELAGYTDDGAQRSARPRTSAAVPGRPAAIATSLVGDGYARPGGVVRQPRQLDRHGGECVVDTRRQKFTERNTTELDLSRRANSEI